MDAIVRGDREAFIEREIRIRQLAMLPPFGRLAAIIVSSEDAGAALAAARAIGAAAPMLEGFSVLGPAAAPLAMLRGRHRQRLLVQARRTLALQQVLRDWLGGVTVPGNVRVVVDIDPYSFV